MNSCNICKVVAFAIALLSGLLTAHTAQAQKSRFSLSCSMSTPTDCNEFQSYWDHATMSDHYDCDFPIQARQCWDQSAYVLKMCKQSPEALDFILAHDASAQLFRKAYAAGEFKTAQNLMYVWEDLNATLMDLLYPISYKNVIQADLSHLQLADAVTLGKIAARYTTDFNGLLKILSPIAINLLACTDIEKQIPNFVRTVLSTVMTVGGVWFAEGPADEPVSNTLIYNGPVNVHLSIVRDDCAGSGSRPSVLIQGTGENGKGFSKQLNIGAPATDVSGNNISIVVVKATKDWPKYVCAAGSLKIQ